MNVAQNTEVQSVSGVTNFAKHLHRQLVKRIGDNVVRHRDDLLVHDARVIEASTSRKFIHVSYCSGTHIYEIPQTIEDNSRIDYLFGRKRPSAIYRDSLELLRDYFGRPAFFGYEHTYCLLDGKDARIISKEEAVSIYTSALNQVLRRLHHRLQ